MTATNYDACFRKMEQWEGWHKFTVTPHDPGGATYCGLTQRAYDGWRSKQRLPPQNVRKATDKEIGDIFRTQYWDPIRGDDLWPGLDLMVYDISVNSGAAASAKILQRALGVKADGWIGLETIAASQRVSDREGLLAKIHQARLGFWRGLSTWRYFGAGWTSRETDVYATAKRMLAISSGVVTAAHA